MRKFPSPSRSFSSKQMQLWELNPEIFAAEKEVSDLVREVFLVRQKFNLVRKELCLVQGKLAAIRAQFGPDSNELDLAGGVRRRDRKRPVQTRKVPAAA